MDGKIPHLEELAELHAFQISNDGKVSCAMLHHHTPRLGMLPPSYVDAYVMIFVDRGWLEMSINYQTYRVDRGRLMLLEPRLLTAIGGYDELLQAYCLIVNRRFFEDTESTRQMLKIGKMLEGGYSLLTVDDNSRDFLIRCYRLAEHIITEEHSMQTEMLRSVIHLLQCDFNEILDRSKVVKLNFTHHEILFRGFANLVAEHFRQEHKIGFYADRLSISTTYLSRIVRNIAHQTVKDFLSDVIYAEACHLLTFTDRTILNISEYLGFANQSAFCKYFAKLSGRTPTEYRRGLSYSAT